MKSSIIRVQIRFLIIKQRFLDITKHLSLTFSMEHLLDTVLEEMFLHHTLDFIVSRGEYLSAKILADVLDFEFIDAKDLIRFRGSKLDYTLTQKTARKFFKRKRKMSSLADFTVLHQVVLLRS